MHVLLTVNDVKGKRNEIDVKGEERWQWEQEAGATTMNQEQQKWRTDNKINSGMGFQAHKY